MATVTHAGTTWNTTAGNKTVVATPAASDLIIVIAATSGLSGGTTNVTDNNSDGLGTYTQVDSDRTGFSTTGVLTVWIRNALIGSASSTTFTAAQGSSTGGGLTVLRVSSMTRTGSLAVKSNGGQSSGTSGTTPAPVLSSTPLTGNPIITAICNGATAASMTQPSSYTEHFDNGYSTPGAGLDVASIDSGITNATITWGSTSATAFASVAIELDTSAIPGPTVTAFETSDWTGTGTPKTITVTGALNGDKIVVLYGGDNGTGGSNVSAATVSTTGGSTSAWTEPEEGLAAGSQAWLSSSVADVTADGTVTVSLARTQSTGDLWGGFALLVHNHGGIGNHARSAPSATETVSLTVSQDSAVAGLAIDWDALATVAFSPAGATDVERAVEGASIITVYAGYWRAQAAGTRGYGIATSSTTNLHIIAVEVLAASGTTPVGKDLQLVWDTRAAVGDPLQMVWDTRAAVTDTLQVIWDVRAALADIIQLIWDTRAALGDPLGLVWDVRAAIGDPLQLIWNVQTLSTPIGKDLSLLWNVRATLGDPLQVVWDTRATLGDTLQAIWNVRAAVGDPVSLVWNTRAAIGDPLDLRWDVRAAVADALQLIWNVQVIGLTAIGKDLGLLWNLKAPAGKDMQLVWDTRAVLADLLDLRWGIRTPIGRASQMVWHVRTVAGDVLVLVWDVESQAYSPILDPVGAVRGNDAAARPRVHLAAAATENSAVTEQRANLAVAAARPNPAEATHVGG